MVRRWCIIQMQYKYHILLNGVRNNANDDGDEFRKELQLLIMFFILFTAVYTTTEHISSFHFVNQKKKTRILLDKIFQHCEKNLFLLLFVFFVVSQN